MICAGDDVVVVVIPPTDQRLDGLRRLARLFDSAFRVPGTNLTFGLDPILGLFPGIGDLASPILTLLILWHAVAVRVPRVVLLRMVLNSLIDAGLGVVPVAGDLFDFAWKANDWNLALLERHAVPGRPPGSFDYLFVILCAVVVIAAALLPIVTLLWLLRDVHLL
jgi:hypothetical protein